MSDKIVIYITTGTYEEAQKISTRLLEERKVACATIVPEVHSHYWWNGSIETGKESLLILKTKSSTFPLIVDIVKELHSYEVPEIIALPIIAVNERYSAWIDNEVTG